MNCDQVRKSLYRFLDNELDPSEIPGVREHLNSCPLCEMEYQQEAEFSRILRNYIPKESAPFSLRERVVERIESTGRAHWLPSWSWLRGVPSAVLAGLCILLLATGVFFNLQRAFPVFAESVERHMEYMQGGLPVEIASSDQEEVTRWLRGKVDFAIHLPDFSRAGVKLIGARLCHLKDKKVAYLLLEKEGREISLFVMNTKDISIPPAEKARAGSKVFYSRNYKGYRSILCIDRNMPGMGCVFVTDMDKDEIIELMA